MVHWWNSLHKHVEPAVHLAHKRIVSLCICACSFIYWLFRVNKSDRQEIRKTRWLRLYNMKTSVQTLITVSEVNVCEGFVQLTENLWTHTCCDVFKKKKKKNSSKKRKTACFGFKYPRAGTVKP